MFYDMKGIVRVGNCEGCDKQDVNIKELHSAKMWFCVDCYDKEIQAQIEMFKDKAKSDSSYPNMSNDSTVNKVLRMSQAIDADIQVKTDIFNASTIAINTLKDSIEADETIVNKPFALATQLMERFTHFKNVVFELNQQIIVAGNEQKAIQIYLNQLANTLKAEERAKLKIADINYKPTAPKLPIGKPIKTAKPKLDKVELRKFAAELNVSEFTLQMVVVSKGISVSEAAVILRNSINSSIQSIKE